MNKELGFTAAAGLKFKQDVILNIRKDGTVEADREGVEAEGEGKKGGKFVSKKIKLDNREACVVVVSGFAESSGFKSLDFDPDDS